MLTKPTTSGMAPPTDSKPSVGRERKGEEGRYREILELLADPDRVQVVEDLRLHPTMVDQAGEFVARLRGDDEAHLGILLPLGHAVAAGRGAVDGGDGRIRRQVFEFLNR